MALEGWNVNNIFKLTIDHTKIDGDLENFPINITLSSGTGQNSFDATDVFDELTISGSSYINRKKIALITTVSGVETELPVEIERWDHPNERANLWVKVPTVVSGTNTELYLYYDQNHVDNTDYIGDTGDSAAQSVWDDNFKGVWHMAQDPNGDLTDAIEDSTSNVNHGTPVGSMTSDDLVDGKIGKALDFDGSDDYIDCTNAAVLQLTSNFNVEAIFSPADDTSGGVLGKYSEDNAKGWGIRSHSDGTVRLAFRKLPSNYYGCVSSTTLTNDVLYYVSFNYVGDGTIPELFINHAKETTSLWIESGDALNGITDSGEPLDVGRSHIFVGNFNYLKGVVDEVRISNTTRSAEWLKATYYSNWNDLINFEEYSVVAFTFTNPIPIHLSTVYGTSQTLQLTVTISGSEPSYIYDATFYDDYDDSQIGTTIYSTESGNYVSTVMSTPSGIGYSWYLTAVSSGIEDTSSIYTFYNAFLCQGTTFVGGTLTSGIPVRLYRRNTGEFIGSTISTSSGTFAIESTFNEPHYAVALYFDDETNSLIYDWISP